MQRWEAYQRAEEAGGDALWRPIPDGRLVEARLARKPASPSVRDASGGSRSLLNTGLELAVLSPARLGLRLHRIEGRVSAALVVRT